MRGDRGSRLGVMAAVAGVGLIAFGSTAAPSFACTPGTKLSVTPAAAAPGAELRVVAEAVGAAKPVELWWVGEGGIARQQVGAATSTADGKLDAVVTAPASAVVGRYLVKLRDVGATRDRDVNALVNVMEPDRLALGDRSLPGQAEDGIVRTTGLSPGQRSSGTPATVLVPLGLIVLALAGTGVAVALSAPRRARSPR